MIKALVSAIFRLLDGVAQLLIPVRHDQVCYLSHPDYGDSAFYMYRHLIRTRQALKHVWLLNDLSSAPRIQREFSRLASGISGHQLQVVAKHSLKGYLLYLGSRCVFYTHGLYSFSKWAFRRQVVCLWHGMPVKCIGALDGRTQRDSLPFGTLHVASSSFFKYVMAAAFRAPPETVKVLGLPRCDALRYEDARGHSAAEIRQALGIVQGRKLVLWLPTFRVSTREDRPGQKAPGRSFLDDVPSALLSELSSRAEAHGCTIIVKLHPKDQLNRTATSFNLPAIRLMRSDEWLRHEIQLYDLLAAADALVSDVSSVVIDFLASGKPIGIAGYDPATYSRDLTLPMDWLLKCDRLHDLADQAARQRFFGALSAAAPGPDETDGITAMLCEALPGRSAELVAQEAGL